jgi:hypothetical protein
VRLREAIRRFEGKFTIFIIPRMWWFGALDSMNRKAGRVFRRARAQFSLWMEHVMLLQSAQEKPSNEGR